MTGPIVVGAGPAGSAAAIRLARAGHAPELIDREARAPDAICGGFLSWRTAARLRELGIDPAALGGHRVTRLRLFARGRAAETRLVDTAYGLSRQVLDQALRDAAVAAGAQLRIAHVGRVAPASVQLEDEVLSPAAIFLATGKHDVRGCARPRADRDPALGLRVRLPAGSGAARLVGDAIELHLFEGGYAGIVLQEDGSTNVCMAVRKSLLTAAGGQPHALLARLAETGPDLAERLDGLDGTMPVDAIAAVPYGFIARDTEPGLYRLGDQAAVIPSLAGEGMAIALTSAASATAAWCAGEDAARYQRRFAQRARRPVACAGLVRDLAERDRWSRAMAGALATVPALARATMRITRI